MADCSLLTYETPKITFLSSAILDRIKKTVKYRQVDFENERQGRRDVAKIRQPLSIDFWELSDWLRTLSLCKQFCIRMSVCMYVCKFAYILYMYWFFSVDHLQ